MAETAQDRHLPATARKIQKAREDGQVARSRDLGHFAAVAAGGALLVLLAPALTAWLQELMAAGLRFDATSLAGSQPMFERLAESATRMVVVVLPMGVVLALMALAAGVLSGGWNWTWKPVSPDFSKLDPISGIGRVFSWHQLGETLKACLLALVLGTVGTLWLRAHAQDFAASLAMPLPAAIEHGAGRLQAGLLLLVVALGIFALVDVPLQRFRLKQRLKMSHQEMKEEMRQLEGNMEVKSKMRARMREAAQRRMLAAVPQGRHRGDEPDPLCGGPAVRRQDHVRAARGGQGRRPDRAAHPRHGARAARCRCCEAPPLARALYAHTELDREVPPRCSPPWRRCWPGCTS
jgi:flagellar biosynthetic protein FlhB